MLQRNVDAEQNYRPSKKLRKKNKKYANKELGDFVVWHTLSKQQRRIVRSVVLKYWPRITGLNEAMEIAFKSMRITEFGRIIKRPETKSEKILRAFCGDE